MSAMRAGDVVVAAQRFANSHSHRLLSAIEMCESRHQSARVEFVHVFFKCADAHHLPVGMKPLFPLVTDFYVSAHFESGRTHREPPLFTGVETPDIVASTSNMQAKSYFAHPMPRAAVRNSLLAAVVGSGTSSWRPSSIASTISFCIMLQSNQASSGCCKTKGPRYLIMGDATALLVRTSTATSRAIPLFSASSTPSEKASICTAKLRLIAIFIESASPLSPT